MLFPSIASLFLLPAPGGTAITLMPKMGETYNLFSPWFFTALELAWSGLALLSVFELSLALKSFWLMLFLLLLLFALLTSMSMMLNTERRRAMMLKVLMLLLAERRVFYPKSWQIWQKWSEAWSFYDIWLCHKPPSVTPHSASPPGNHRTGSGDGPGGPEEQFTRYSSSANPGLPNLHSAYLGDSAPLEGLCAEAVLAFCSCLPAVWAKPPLVLVQQVAGGELGRR